MIKVPKIRIGILLRILIYGGLIVGLYALYSQPRIRYFIDNYAHYLWSEAEYKVTLTTPRKKFEEIRAAYRLQPDRRFIHAFTTLCRLPASSCDDNMPIYTNDHWHYVPPEMSQEHLFSEYPAFSEIVTALRDYAQGIVGNIDWNEELPTARVDAIERNVNTYDPSDLNAILSALNKLWNEGYHSRRLVTLAARTLARRAFISLDDVGVADNIQSNALAMVVLAEVAGGEPLPRELSLVAYSMGYETYSHTLANSLPNNDPWRIFIENRDKRLFKEAANTPLMADVHYYALIRASELNDSQLWYKMINQMYGRARPPIHIIATAYHLRGINYERWVSSYMPHLVLAQIVSEEDAGFIKIVLAKLNGGTGDHDPVDILINYLYEHINGKPEKLIDYFEYWLERASDKYNGPFIDSDDFTGFYRGYLYTALYRLGIYYVYHYNSIEKAEEYKNWLAGTNTEIGRQFNVWMQNVIQGGKGKPNLKKISHDIDSMSFFGANPLLKLLDIQIKNYGYGSELAPTAIQHVMGRMDSRPGHRRRLANLLYNKLLMFSRSESLYGSLRRDESLDNSDVDAWLGHYYKNTDKIWAVVNNEHAMPVDRIYALELIDDVDAVTRGTTYQRIIATDPSEWRLRKKYVKFLEDKGYLTSALHELQDWLQIDANQFGTFDYLQAVDGISRIQIKRKKPGLAVAAALPQIESYYEPALNQAIDALLAEKRYTDAMKVAQMSQERYPRSLWSLMYTTRVYWSMGDNDKAAKLINTWPNKISESDWRNVVAKVFIETFGERDDDAEKAFKILVANSKHRWWLQEIAVLYAHKENYEMAFKLGTQIGGGGQSATVLNIRAYKYLKQYKGRDVAIAWLDGHIPPPNRNMSSMIFYDEAAYELLWELIPNPEAGEGAEYVWLMRAAAFAEGAEISAEQRKQLFGYYQSADDRHYHLLGKYMLGLVKDEKLYDMQIGRKELCEMAFFIGIKKMTAHDYYSAADWFQVSIAAGEPRWGEYRWSYDRMYRWRSWSRSLDVLAEEGKIFRKEI